MDMAIPRSAIVKRMLVFILPVYSKKLTKEK
jgi:hypothetical protein